MTTNPQTAALTPAEQAMMWERMSGERLSDAQRAAAMRGEAFQPPTTEDADRADILNAAIDYAIEQGFEGMAWLEAWREGDQKAMADLDAWRTQDAQP